MTISTSAALLRSASLILACTLATPSGASSTQDLLDQLRSRAAGAVQFHSVADTGYALLRATGVEPLLADPADAAPLSRALGFLDQFGALVGVADVQTELLLQRVSSDRAGGTHVHLDQLHAGLPVFGARLVVHMNDSGIRGVSGVFLNGLSALATQTKLAADTLDQRALLAARKLHPQAELAIASSRPLIYRSGLLEGFAGRDYLAREVMVISAAGDVRERIILDARAGGIINIINEIHSALNREIYSPNENVAPLITEGSALAPADPALTGDGPSDPLSRVPQSPLDNLYLFAGGTYALYRNLFGREGYDEGTVAPQDQVQRSVYLVNEVCPNAYWNGVSTNYCPGFDADDVVSHEWSHAYTEFTHGLIYQYQSGALNEAYSDIFGEVYDLVNGLEGPLGVTLTEGEYFENGGSRWVLGEDLSEPLAAVLLRDMWDPDAFALNAPLLGIQILSTPSPGSVISSPNYFCGTGDGGGVHTNSGVPNHAFAMLVDGKSFNGVDIPAIGMTRAAHIYFHAMTHYQIPSTNFGQHADALAQSCLDLVGVPLNDVLGNPSPDVIDSATCAAVEAAMLAVEMRQSPAEKCNYLPLLQAEDSVPALCGNGATEVVSFSETWESGALPVGWTTTENVTGDTAEDGVRWSVVDELPEPHTGFAAFIANTFGGTCAVGGDISASFLLDSPSISVEHDDAVLSLNHLMQSELAFDGGNLQYSLNDGGFVVVPAAAISVSPYNVDLDPAPGNTNPLAGQPAWSGTDQGESLSRWGISRISLAGLGAEPGDTIRFRFAFGQDGCNGNLGWYVDDVQISHCATDAPAQSAPTVDAPARNASTRGGGFGWGLLGLSVVLLLRRRVRA